MLLEGGKILTTQYALLRNRGLKRADDLTEWEYRWANLSFPDGMSPSLENFHFESRLGKRLSIHDYPYMD